MTAFPRPALFAILSQGYRADHLRRDVIAGLTVAIVAVPLSMAIAIASGVPPQMGLYTAIIGGFVIAALGGSRFQIGGPAGAFIVLVAATVAQHGVQGMVLATLLAGVMIAVMGLLRLGGYIRYIPYPVTVGFTAGIAVIIFASQAKDLLGLTLSGPEPGPILEKLPVIWAALPSLNPVTAGLALATIVMIVALKRWAARVPNLLVAVAVMTALVWALDLQTPTIRSTFGALPTGLPMPVLPALDMALVWAVLPNAVGFALLGSIEALLSAVVADSMSGHRHDSDMELIAQGVANVASGLMGGMVATGTIARTATNVRANAHGPVAGMLHALFVLAFVLVATPLIEQIPLAALAGVLATVAWNMIERHAIVTLLRASREDAAVLLVTLGLTVFRDLTEAIIVGFAMGSVLFIHRLAKATDLAVVPRAPAPAGVTGAAAGVGRDDEIVVYRIEGAFFFAAAAGVGGLLHRIADTHRGLVLDLSRAAMIDSTALHTIEDIALSCRKRGVLVVLAGSPPALAQTLALHGLHAPLVHIAPDAMQGVALAQAELARMDRALSAG